MILLVDEDLFTGHGVADTDRLGLLRLAGRRHTTLLVQSAARSGAAASTPTTLDRWCDGLRDRVQREARRLKESVAMSSAAAGQFGAERVLVSDRWPPQTGACVVTLDECLRLLSEPLHVLVENGLRDGAFLRTVMDPEWRDRVREWETKGVLRFENAGGITELKAIVEAMARDDDARRYWGLPASVWRLLHFVVFDHDGETPPQPSADAAALAAACKQKGFAGRSHMLKRRRQEYYLPRELMEWVADNFITATHDQATRRAEIAAFFEGDRTHGPLPGNDGQWKGRFWRHRDRATEWDIAWFKGDGVWPESRGLAESLQRCI